MGLLSKSVNNIGSLLIHLTQSVILLMFKWILLPETKKKEVLVNETIEKKVSYLFDQI